MELSFYKYQGAGNDFIMVNGFDVELRPNRQLVASLCDRRFGIGADGLIVIRPAEADFDFEMVYYNADGGQGSMCGNGGRCAFRFALDLGIVGSVSEFLAVDGPHEALLTDTGLISLKMIDVNGIHNMDDKNFTLNTGSPHYIKIVDDIDAVDVFKEGRRIRYSDEFRKEGINVNFVQILSDGIRIATYERGVEDETLACGTGVTAAALVMMQLGYFDKQVSVKARGGDLWVSAIKDPQSGIYESVWLTGPAELSFKGVVAVPDNTH